MKKLSIPYAMQSELLYESLTDEYLQYIKEIYMPLPFEIIGSARTPNSKYIPHYSKIFDNEVSKYSMKPIDVVLVVNNPAIPRDKYDEIINKIAEIKDKIKKVIISDFYFLDYSLKAFENFNIEIEISVISELNSIEKIRHFLEAYPSVNSICLYYNFLYDLESLKKIRKEFKYTKFKVIVNHGCFYNCPFSFQHHLALCQSDLPRFFCKGYNKKRNLLKEIQFIRPESLNIYDDYIDIYKISGRQHSHDKILKMIKSYGERKESEFINSILDLNGKIKLDRIPNNAIPAEYDEIRSKCKNQCHKCGYCDKLYNSFGI
ncbi:hypothetical protein [Desulforamulus aeronauticus]|uniref:Collagenase-like protease, PrtC family n=1 Tax=Desulforamulus aeronauticus DSM 10349 TaxID=1121421 RepID=A0A1M6QES0_9FIRM|nr:hypothetical protein [Desulforamulus aeronauticus]SHK18610.1 Collagenase-like protease, PrtC family [Desulforamulus aeronauticus DSM 10349]